MKSDICGRALREAERHREEGRHVCVHCICVSISLHVCKPTSDVPEYVSICIYGCFGVCMCLRK